MNMENSDTTTNENRFGGENKATKNGMVATMKLFRNPRPGKKLLILDVDRTIYDCTPSSLYYRRRPYLYYLLEKASKDYDIGLWSATDMKYLELKVDSMKIGNDSTYDILFYLDIWSTIQVPVKERIIMTKPLSTVWNVLPEYGPSNTVICDDRSDNFVQNPKNGILVSPYYFENFLIDQELEHLVRYLQYLSKLQDVTKIDHGKWKEIERNLTK